MRKVIVSEFVTLDGVMEDPRWTFQFPPSEDQLKFKLDELFSVDALLLGRVTYQGFAAAWPSMKGDAQGYGDRMNNLQKYVVSKTLQKVEWNNSSLIKGNVMEEVAKLKQQPGKDILVFGSMELARSLMQSDLVDELRLLVYPIVLGSGKRLFKDGVAAKLKLIEARAFASGVALLRYQPVN